MGSEKDNNGLFDFEKSRETASQKSDDKKNELANIDNEQSVLSILADIVSSSQDDSIKKNKVIMGLISELTKANERVDRLEKRQDDAFGHIDDELNKFNIKNEQTNKKIDEVMGVVTKRANLSANYVNQATIGRGFKPEIGSQYIGRLFRALGMAIIGGSVTIPTRDMVTRKFVHADEFQKTSDRTHYFWHEKKTCDEIEKRLEKLDKWKEFSLQVDEQGMKDFINRLLDDNKIFNVA